MKPIHTIIHSADSEAVGIWWNCDFSLSQWSPQSGRCDGVDLRWYNYTVRDSGYSAFTTSISAWLKCMLGMICYLMCVVLAWPGPDRWSVCVVSAWPGPDRWSHVCVVSAWPGPDRWSHQAVKHPQLRPAAGRAALRAALQKVSHAIFSLVVVVGGLDKKRSCRKCVNLLELLLAVWCATSKILEQCVYYHEKIQRHHLVKSTPACSY